MKLPASQALFGHWSSLRQGRRAPERAALDLTAMRHVLAHTFMLDVDPAQAGGHRFPLRLSGTRLDALFGRDLKGSAFVDLWAGPDQAAIRRIITDVLDETTPAIIGGEAGPAGAPRLGFELLLLPLRHAGRTHARLLGGIALASTPTWLGLQPSAAFAVATWRSLDEGASAPTDDDSLSDGNRRGHLIVHQGGRAGEPVRVFSEQARVKTAVSRWADRR